MESRVHHVINDEDFESRIDGAAGALVVVDFTATWCGPCRRLAPIFNQMSIDHFEVTFLKIDADECPDIVEKCSVKAFPTIIFYKDGLQVDTLVGVNPTQLEANIVKFKNLQPGVVQKAYLDSVQSLQITQFPGRESASSAE